MVSIQLGSQTLTAQFTANAAIADQEVVALTGANQVEPATDTETQQAVGVANEAATSGETVEVVILGRKTVVADGAIAAGDPVRAATTAGRVVSETTTPASHTHTMNTTHSHTALDTDGTDATAAAHQGVLAGDGTDATLVAGVDTSGQAAETINTDSVNPGDADSTDPSPEHSRVIGKAVGTTSGAGESVEVLVALTG